MIVEQRLRRSAGQQQFLADLFLKSISASDICRKHQVNQANAAAKFLEFLTDRPPVNSWSEWLMSDYIEDYLKSLKDRGLSTNTLRSYANVFRLLNRTVHRKTREPKAEVQCYLPKRVAKMSKSYLVLEKLAAAIQESRNLGDVRAEIGFTLGGLMGLRLEEIAYLCRSDFNKDEMTLFIHDSKNPYSTRTLPVPAFCLSILEKMFLLRDVQPRKQDPRNALYASHEPISHGMRLVMRSLHCKTLDEAYGGIVKPMDARKTFQNLCTRRELGLSWWLVEAYMGHKLPGEGESYQHLRVTDKCLPEIRLEAIEKLRVIPAAINIVVENAFIAK